MKMMKSKDIRCTIVSATNPITGAEYWVVIHPDSSLSVFESLNDAAQYAISMGGRGR